MTEEFRIGAAAILVAAASSAAPAAAQTTDAERLQALEIQLQALQAEIAELKADRSPEAQTAKAEKIEPAASPKVEMRPAPRLTSEDGDFSFDIRGRVEADIAAFDADGTDFNSGTQLRRARLGADGKMFGDWGYRLEAEFANAARDDNDGEEVEVTFAYVQYLGVEDWVFTAGQHKTPTSMERLMSSTSLTFMERAMASEAFTRRTDAGGDFKAGLSADYIQDNWTLSGGVFGENFAISRASGVDEGYGLYARATVAPIKAEDRFLHLGASGYWRETAGGGVVRFRDRPEVRVDNSRVVDTGVIAAEDYQYAGAELAGAYGPLFLQSEYAATFVSRETGLGELGFEGGFAAIGWFLTGETLPYEDGVIGRVKPARNFDPENGGWGALALTGRYSTIDLNDEDILGGEAETLTLGLNWYLNPYLRVLANYIHFDSSRAGAELDGDVAAARLAVDW